MPPIRFAWELGSVPLVLTVLAVLTCKLDKNELRQLNKATAESNGSRSNMGNEEIYRKQVIRTFFKNGMLLNIPTQNRKKDVVLQKISTRLIQNKLYSDDELNEILKKLYPDFEKLKTELLASRFVKTTKGLHQLATCILDTVPVSGY